MEVCRICLSKQVNKDISELHIEKSNDQNNYSDIMLFCLDIQVKEDSKIGTKLCLRCYKKILGYHKFKTLALKNDAYLRSIGSSSASKHELFVTDYLKPDKLNIECLVLPDDIKEEHDYKEEDTQDYESDDELLSVVKLIKYEFLAEENNDVTEETKITEEIKNITEETKNVTEETMNITEETKNLTEESKENAPIKKRRGRPKSIKTDIKCEKKEREICEECGKSVWNLKEHSAMHLPIELRKRFKCKGCDKLFCTYNARRRHFRIKHLGIKKHCDICNKEVQCLKAHHLTMHDPASLPFECPPCGRRFLSASLLHEHMTIHTKDRPYECEICKKKFRSKIVMSQHKRQVHDKEKSHLCQFCSKSFFKKYHLQVHLRHHTKEKPYECAECGKSFASRTVLQSHSLIHSKVKMYECTYCDSTFSKPGYLRNHMISHTKEKKHPCKYCGVKFGRSDHRKRHEFTAHEKHLATAP